jgi:hypothetical protein
MSAERIDHAAEALRIMNIAHDNADQGAEWRSEHQMKRSQVHATLALVEQQRIANLIAAISPRIVSNWSFSEAEDLRSEIRKGLGL